MREYVENLMKPLVTNEKLEELLKSFQDEIVKRFEHKIKEQNTKIEEFQSKLAMKQTAIDNLEIKYDDNKHIAEDHANVFMASISTAVKIIMSHRTMLQRYGHKV